MVNSADVVCGLAWGDEAKGKITAHLAASQKYDCVARWAGGSNAGHTIWMAPGAVYKTHVIPSGVFFNKPSIIGPGCVVHKKKFFKEMEYLDSRGFDTSLVKISPRAHVVTDSHIEADTSKLVASLGTTGSGIAPCYSAKAARVGLQAKDVFSSEFLWDEKLSGDVLCEGAQGFWLDLDWGNYPYVTSSTTLPYGACSLGFPTQKIRKIYGAAKIYDTRSGIDPLFPETLFDDPDLELIGEIGKEYGVTTGRKRKVNWLNLTMLKKAITMTGTTDVIISKCDILEAAEKYALYDEGVLIKFKSLENMKTHISESIFNQCEMVEAVTYSSSLSGI